jgi:hypothetical protein
MASQSWGQVIADLGAAGQSYSSFTTAQSLLTTATATAASTGFVTLPPGFFRVGGVLDYECFLAMGSATGQTWTFSVKVGSASAWSSGAVPVTTTTNTTLPLYLKFTLRCVTVGNGTLATLWGTGIAMGIGISPLGGATPATNTTAGMGFSPLNVTALGAGTGFDSTIANTLDFLVASGTSAANNTIQLLNYRVTSWGNTAP